MNCIKSTIDLTQKTRSLSRMNVVLQRYPLTCFYFLCVLHSMYSSHQYNCFISGSHNSLILFLNVTFLKKFIKTFFYVSQLCLCHYHKQHKLLEFSLCFYHRITLQIVCHSLCNLLSYILCMV